MRSSVKLTVYGLTLAAVFVVTWTIGAAIGPLDTPPPPSTDTQPYNHEAH